MTDLMTRPPYSDESHGGGDQFSVTPPPPPAPPYGSSERPGDRRWPRRLAGGAAILGLVAGFMGDLQTFGAMIGSSTVLIGNAPSNTPVGPNYVGSGIGGQATGANGAPGYPVHTAAPAPIFQYSAMDGGATGAPGASG